MLARILAHFPPHTHPLTLAGDPDGLLAGEAALVELAGRGFRIIQESDPVVLRCQVDAARPFSPENPLLIITPGDPDELPFDLWQQAHRVTLNLHQFFPTLAYPVLKTLSPRQLEKITALQPDARSGGERLGRLATMDTLLRQVFDLDLEAVGRPYVLIAWLVHLHDQLGTLPEPLVGRLLEHLRKYPDYQEWDLPALLQSREAFSAFLQTEWQAYLRAPAGGAVRDGRLPFHQDEGLQNLLPSLVRKGVLTPETAGAAGELPEWAKAGVTAGEEHRHALISTLLDELAETACGFSIPVGWEEWQAVAFRWARLNALWHAPESAPDEQQAQQRTALAGDLDRSFAAWLAGHYAPLGAQRLPQPKHVFHVPHYLAYLRGQGKIERVALLVLDGMSLWDWLVVRPAWESDHPGWQFTERLLLAQIPTITALSRRSLVSGLRPADFAADMEHMPAEKALWAGFWSRGGLPGESVFYSTLSLDRQDYPPEVDRARLAALCLVDDTLDRLVHNAVLGAASQQAALRLWLERGRAGNSEPLERLIDRLIERGFSVFLASDHGHVEAQGIGAPAEGILAQTRGKRARLYPERLAAQRAQGLFPESILWENDGLLPAGLSALLPDGRTAFATKGEAVVTHGGVSLDEVIVPFVQISKH